MAHSTYNISTLHQNLHHPIPQAATHSSTPASAAASGNSFVMSTPPVRRRGPDDSYKPKIITTVGARPACLVNASVTFVGNDQIYAFGGFDQYTDEGMHVSVRKKKTLLTFP